MRLIRRIAFLLVFSALLVPQAAQASWLDWLFGKREKTPPPEETLTAPFAQITGARVEGQAVHDISVPHRDEKHVAEWLQRAISEVLTIEAATYEDHLKYLATGMDSYALEDFKKFMESSKILEYLQGGRYRLGCVVESRPALLNEGPVESRYRWLYDVPVTITFLPGTMKSYEEANPVSQHIIVQVQAGRVAQGGADGVMIESWTVRANPDKTIP